MSTRNTGPQIAVRGIRATIPSGYMLGRTSAGDGPAELIPINGQSGLGSQMQQAGSAVSRLSQLLDVGLTSLSDKQRLRYSAGVGKWVNVDDTLANLTDVNTTGVLTGSLLQFSGTAWVPHTPLLSDDGDVAISAPSNLQVLQYNSGTGKWANATITLGSTTLAGDTDVAITSPLNGQSLLYNSVSGKWVNGTPAGGSGSSTLAGDTDVSITAPADKQALIYVASASKWENVTLTFAYNSDVAITTPANGDLLKYNSTTSKWENSGAGVGSHRYWGLMNITPYATASPNPCIAEIELHATVGGAAVSLAAATATATSFFTGLGPANAIDGNAATLWAANSGTQNQDFKLDLGVGHTTPVAEIKITTRNDSSFAQGAAIFDVCYSDDGVIWMHVSHVSGPLFTSAGQAQTFKVKL